MKAVLDPSMLLWDSDLVERRQYLLVADDIRRHLTRLEGVPMEILMPRHWAEIYSQFPYHEEQFRRACIDIRTIFFRFVTNNLHRLKLMDCVGEPVVLQPDICPRYLDTEWRLELRGFMGTLGLAVHSSEVGAALLTSLADRYASTQHRLRIIITARKVAVEVPAVISDADWDQLELELDYRPDIVKCVEVCFARLYANVDGARLRPFEISPRLRKQLEGIMYSNPTLFRDIVSSMARFAGGVMSGLKAHKLSGGIMRLDVHKGAGDKLHAYYDGSTIVFSEYHSEHDRYRRARK